MNTQRFILSNGASRRVIGIVGAALLVFACSSAYAQDPAAADQAPPIPAAQIDSLVAPIALYPDTLLAQTLAASTYPLEVMQLDQWMAKNATLKDQALADAVAKQPWDPSVQSMAAYPDVVKRMAENIQWMTEVGNAFIDQQKDVMDAVQRMRAKAQGTGNLKTGGETTVESKTSQGGQQVVVIQQTNPESVYVPSYDPAVVYGAAPADAPYYPYTYPGYQPGRALAWGSAIAMTGVWANNNWGNCNWDDGDVTINNKNTYNKNTNVNVNKGSGNGWQHNPQHRGNAPYANKQTANKYGGKTAGGAGKPGGAGGVGGAGKPGGPGGAGGVGGAGKPGGPGGAGGVGSAGKPGGPGGAGGVGSAGKPGGPGGAGGAGGAGKPGGPGGAGGVGGAGKPGGAGGAGGGNKVGNHSVSSGSNGNALGGPGANGASAKAASNRGGASAKGGGGGGGGHGAKAGGGGGGAKAGGGGGGRGGGGGGGGRGGGGGGGRKR